MGPDGKLAAVYIPFLDQMSTDDRGIYRIYGLPTGRYVVGFRSDNKTVPASSEKQYPLAFYPGVSDEDRAREIDVSVGKEVTDIDFNFAEKEPGFSASGRIVFMSSGEAAANVEFVYGKAHAKSGEPAPHLRTDENGAFRIEGLPPGKYFVEAVRYSGPGNGDPVQFEITDADVSGLEVKVTRGSVITGTVSIEGADNKMVIAVLQDMEIQVSAFPYSGDREDEHIQFAGRVAPDHSFKVTGVRPGKLSFSVEEIFAWGHFQMQSIEIPGVGSLINDTGDTQQFFKEHRIDIKDGQNLDGVAIKLIAADCGVNGHVTFEGATIPNTGDIFAYVYYTKLDVPKPEERIGGAADLNGEFVMRYLVPGQYKIRVALERMQGLLKIKLSEVSKTVFLQSGKDTDVSLVLKVPANP